MGAALALTRLSFVSVSSCNIRLDGNAYQGAHRLAGHQICLRCTMLSLIAVNWNWFLFLGFGPPNGLRLPEIPKIAWNCLNRAELNGAFPDFVLRGCFASWTSTGKQPIKKRGIKRFLAHPKFSWLNMLSEPAWRPLAAISSLGDTTNWASDAGGFHSYVKSIANLSRVDRPPLNKKGWLP